MPTILLVVMLLRLLEVPPVILGVMEVPRKTTATADVERCQCQKTLDASNKGHYGGCEIIYDCDAGSQQPDSKLTLTNASVAFKPRGKGFRMTWFANSSAVAGALKSDALFALERKLAADNSCITIVLNTTERPLSTDEILERIDLECNYSEPLSGIQYNLTLLSLPRPLSKDKTNTFTGIVLAPKDSGLDWMTTTFIQRERASCSENSNIIISFTLPELVEFEFYMVILCIDSSRCNHHYRSQKTSGNEVNFNDVTPGKYYLWISPDGDYGNSASDDNFIIENEPAPTWDADLKAKSQCLSGVESCCIDIQFLPANPSLRYKNYTIHIWNGTTKVSYKAVDKKHESGKELICGLTSGFYEIEVSPTGECPTWEKSHKVGIRLEIPTTPSDDIWRTIGGILAAVAFFIAATIIAAKYKFRNGGPALCASLKTSVALNCGRKRSSRDTISESEGVVFGGSTTTLLLLYARDHECHVSLIKSFAEILRQYGGFEVNIDQWFEADAVQRNDWLGRQIAAASVVIIFSSDGARLLHEAFLENQTYRKYANTFPASFQIPEALALAERLPPLRRKLVKASAEYSTTGLNMSDWSTPAFVIPAQIPELVCYLHGAPPDSEWSCTQQFLHSKQYVSILHYVKRMSRILARTPNLFEHTFGPAEDRLDSGIDQLSSRLWQEGSFDVSAGCTEIYTLHSPDPPLLSDIGYKWPIADQKAYDLPRLNTEMPNTEDLWRAHALSGSSPVSSELVSIERFRLMLMQMTSVSSSNNWTTGGGSDTTAFNGDPLLDMVSCRAINMSDIEVVDEVRL